MNFVDAVAVSQRMEENLFTAMSLSTRSSLRNVFSLCIVSMLCIFSVYVFKDCESHIYLPGGESSLVCF